MNKLLCLLKHDFEPVKAFICYYRQDLDEVQTSYYHIEGFFGRAAILGLQCSRCGKRKLSEKQTLIHSHLLQDAYNWLSDSPKVNSIWDKDSLYVRFSSQ